MAFPTSWGPIHQATTDGKTVAQEEGEVRRGSLHGLGAAAHPQDYDATDGRHGRESNIREWPSIDHMSGPTSHEDFGETNGSFPDGPGVWRQT